MGSRGMKTSTIAGIVGGVVLLAASISGLAGYLWAQNASGIEPPPPRGLPAVWPTKHGEIPRPVPMPTGEMIAALPQSTAGHVLCQALPPKRWEEILGGKTLREAQSDACHLVTDTLEVFVRLDRPGAEPPGPQAEEPEQVDVDGRPGQLEYAGAKLNAKLTVPLAAQPPNASEDIRTMLRIDIGQDPNHRADEGLDEQVTAIARGVLTAAAAPGPGLPPVGRNGVITARQTEPVPGHGIVDGSWPMISWQLCTRLSRELGTGVGAADAKFKGDCAVRGVHATYTQDLSPRAYTTTIAGRPASVQQNAVTVKLADNSEQALTLSTDGKAVSEADLPGFTGRVLPALLGR
ncbi:hypothetical protein [Amycolatopsis anabasis]|uniref:hypothetical protein n=1 Tax=Amycolatopsis anabasis TaxID=1840409 RepID=UPI00131D617B|nr:hypothetical protein [Amycolatopsis anabasis]